MCVNNPDTFKETRVRKARAARLPRCALFGNFVSERIYSTFNLLGGLRKNIFGECGYLIRDRGELGETAAQPRRHFLAHWTEKAPSAH